VNADWVEPKVIRRGSLAGVDVGTNPNFDDWFHAEYVGLVRLVTLMVGSQGLAEEAVQDAFVTLYEKWARTREPGAYVRTVALNNARRIMRRSSSEKRAYQKIGPLTSGVEEQSTPLVDTLAKLAERQRMAIVLKYYADFSEVDIAAAVGCRKGTVKSLLSRAKAELRTMLEEEQS
jgi:RNA polymerase sigma factor (sigma-70 family)